MELIRHTSYQGLAPHWKAGEELPKSGTVYVGMEDIWEFFLQLERTEVDAKYVVITSFSDYSVMEQDKHPPYKDMYKWLRFISPSPDDGYNPLFIPARINPTTCRATDKYSIKVYSFTNWTFDRIPKQVVKWFCTNCDIDDPRVVHIPFGIPDWSYDLITTARANGLHLSDDRPIQQYSNFQLNTLERVAIRNGYVSTGSGVYTEQNEISHEQFVERLLKSHIVLCPSGNGLDTYRNLEALYCGCLPYIMTEGNGHWLTPYRALHVTGMLNSGTIVDFKWKRTNVLDDTPADLDYWRKQISEASQLV
jgi:hypothetical protein